jgi:prophage regulatory protein
MSQSIPRLRVVQARTGLSRSSIYKRMSEGTFPRSVRLGLRARGWLESDLDTWIEGCVKASRDTTEESRAVDSPRAESAVMPPRGRRRVRSRRHAHRHHAE